MNFDDAINAHTRWKIRLRMVIEGLEKLDPAVVCQDNQCELGKWIYGEGLQYQGLPSYHTLKTEHAHFHQCAAAVVSKANTGNKAAATAMLGAASEFAQTSQSTVHAILQMKKEAS